MGTKKKKVGKKKVELPLSKHITVESQQKGLEEAEKLLTNGVLYKSGRKTKTIFLNEVSFTDETTGKRYRLEKIDPNFDFHHPTNELRRYHGNRLVELPSIIDIPRKKKWQE
ncbi:MAG TPA: hypothetical protein PLO44_02910 [Candidatus Paceibacterota bacterium]|nr:hypothetical protein [Candidatus Paceibacterota bacterium]